MRWTNGCIVSRALRHNLLAECRSSDEVVEEAPVECRVVNNEKEIVAADDRPVKKARNDAKASNFRVALRHEKLTGAAHLLRLRLNKRSGDFISQDDTLSMQLDSRPSVGGDIIDSDE